MIKGLALVPVPPEIDGTPNWEYTFIHARLMYMAHYLLTSTCR